MLVLSTQDSSRDIFLIPGGFLILTEFPGDSWFWRSSRVGSLSSRVGKLPAVTLFEYYVKDKTYSEVLVKIDWELMEICK